MMNEDTNTAIDKMKANLSVLTDSESSTLEKAVALEQLKANATSAFESFKEKHT